MRSRRSPTNSRTCRSSTRGARSPRRAAFYCAAVAALDAGLRERGSKLIVRRGAAGPTLRNLARASGAIGVAWSASYDGAGCHADARLQSDLEEAGLQEVCDAISSLPERARVLDNLSDGRDPIERKRPLLVRVDQASDLEPRTFLGDCQDQRLAIARNPALSVHLGYAQVDQERGLLDHSGGCSKRAR